MIINHYFPRTYVTNYPVIGEEVSRRRRRRKCSVVRMHVKKVQPKKQLLAYVADR